MSGSMFPGQHPNEHFLFFFHKHWVELFYPIARFLAEQFILVLLLLVLFFRGNSMVHTGEGQIFSILIIMGLLITVLSFWVRVFNYLLRIIIVTDYRIIDMQQSLFVANDEDVTDLREIQDIKAEMHGFWKNILKCGTITFVLTAANLAKVFHNVRYPTKVSQKIVHIREIYKKLEKGEYVSPFV